MASGAAAGVLPSGFARLDTELPGGGWPQRVLTELLLPHLGVGEMRLLAPVLARVAQSGRSVMLLDPPAQVSAEALAQLGLPPAQCIVVRGRAAPGTAAKAPRLARRGPVDACWALEQALRSGQVGALLAWLGVAARPEVLRRLQLAAQAHDGPVFLLRDARVSDRPSPAPLRLVLGCSGPDELAVQILKRHGPVLAQPVQLALTPVLSVRALAKARAGVKPPAPVRPVETAGTPAWLASLTGQFT
jgi:protein ImuA